MDGANAKDEKAAASEADYVTRAKRILVALKEAAKAGKGAAQLDGRMIDAVSARMAENIVNIDKAIRTRLKRPAMQRWRLKGNRLQEVAWIFMSIRRKNF
ncbi:MAG: hypothetical protein ACHBNF_14165 [Chromatiales bacterium]